MPWFAGFVSRLGSVWFCVPWSSPGEGFPHVSLRGFLLHLLCLHKFITAAGVKMGMLKQSGEIAWLVISEQLLMVGLAHHSTPLLSHSWPLGCWE